MKIFYQQLSFKKGMNDFIQFLLFIESRTFCINKIYSMFIYKIYTIYKT